MTLLSLRLIETMLDSGYDSCLSAFSNDRTTRVQHYMDKLGVQLPTTTAVIQLAVKDLIGKMEGWMSLLNLWSNLSSLEWMVAHQSVPENVLDTVLLPVYMSTLEPLLRFVNDIFQATRDVELVFPMLSMHQALMHIYSHLDQIFSYKSLLTVKQMLTQAINDLATHSKSLFAGFQKEVCDDHSMVEIEPGTVHPRTAYVVRILKRMFRDKQVEMVIFKQESLGVRSSVSPSQSMRSSLISIVQALQNNLKHKAAQLYHKDQALQSLFQMNNLHFVVTAVENTEELLALVGEKWVEQHSHSVEEHANEFIKRSWETLGNKTEVEGMDDVASGDHLVKKDRQRVKDTFKAFNTSLQQLYKHQVDWCIPDAQLRSAIIAMIVDEVVPDYKELLQQFKEVDFTKNLDKYIVYNPEQVEEMLRALFTKNTHMPALSHRSSRDV
eukprot:TRINITY_DN12012_c0_g1_i2.p1 TRINITY_DN12012_c0_g1~~TRINITY_DN12012_c0_g1_i2.p1  ORF type:complete len:479 (-),score=44.24 TRINITY_DN12012_c0_g1_i2:400-1716(-)